MRRLPEAKRRSIFKAFNYLDRASITWRLNTSKYKKIFRGSSARMLFFFFLYLKIHSMNCVNSNQVSTDIVLTQFVYSIVASCWNNKLFQSIRDYLLFIFEILVKGQTFRLSFFLIDSQSVSAKFLSRFIARRLKQNYTVNELIHPIKNELRIVDFMSTTSLTGYMSIMNKTGHKYTKARKLWRGYLGIFLHFFFRILIDFGLMLI